MHRALIALLLGASACGAPLEVDAGMDAASGAAIGEACDDGTECASGVCFPTGFGTSACTETCDDDDGCPRGWACDDRSGRRVCTCAASAETCDGADQDCDARVDEGAPETLGCGAGQVCEAGSCTCGAGDRCDGECVDVSEDPRHCGACGAACAGGERCRAGACCAPAPESCNGADDDCDQRIDEGLPSALGCAPGETCSGGACACGATCDDACVDTTADARHCGGCDRACADGLDCVDGACCEAAGTRVDVLFVIDTSNSMREEQASLSAELPRMVRVLATGDLNLDGVPETAPVRDLHLGVITPDMGSGGHTVPTCRNADRGEDAVLRTHPGITDGCAQRYPSFLAFDPAVDDPATTATDLACVATAGTGGCGVEQPLEAVLKAVTPASSAVRFHGGSTGHADGANAGFLRPDSVLVTILLTDEDDCSVRDAALFDPDGPYADTDLNLRCHRHPEALHPIERYVDGLLATRRDPRDLVFAAITGIPVDLLVRGVEPDYPGILADPRMQERIDPDEPARLLPSCDVGPRGVAYPPRRLVSAARAVEAAGGTGALGTLCKPDAGQAITAILERLTARLTESCVDGP